MIGLGLVMLATGLGMLFAMVIHVVPSSLWLALAAHAASLGGVFLAVLAFAARNLR